MSDSSRLIAALAGRYRIERELGKGGMATVYLAHDLKHDRDVAIKVLHPELAAALGAERFLAEITVTARLHHPHILPLYDSGESAGFLFYVMPLAEGETLRDRLNREKQLPIDDALQIAREVADALSYAHARGVIHRDIKPENILLESRHALVADFGIARAITAAGGEKLTATGLAVGTPTYMSPEQAAGERDLDGRSDLYALGCVLYEMLAGQPPFTGPTMESIVRQHMNANPPPITQLRPAVPSHVAAALQRALAKTPADRFNPVAQFAEALAATRPVPPSADSSRTRLVVAGLIVVAVIASAALLFTRLRSGDSAPVIGGTVQVTRDPGLEVDPALSPDGQLVAYAAGHPSHMQIFVRQVSGGRIIALTNDSTRNHRWPRWSPDGSRIAYQIDEGIDVVPALGGQPRSVLRQGAVTADSNRTDWFARLAGFAWSPDGRRIAYASGFGGKGVTILPLDGGEPTHIAAVRDVHSLAWSPDATRLAAVSDNPVFVFGAANFGNQGASSIWVIPLNGSDPVRVTKDGHLNMSPQWSEDGRYLFWVSDRGGSRDVYRVRLDGTGTPAAAPYRLTTGADAHTISLSADGSHLAYSSFGTLSNIWSIPVPSSGSISSAEARPVTTGNQTIEAVHVSRDGRWLTFDSDRNGNSEIYKMPTGGGEALQLTTHPTGDYGATWSPDGRRIAFHSLRDGNRDVFTMESDGSGLAKRTASPAHELSPDWSPDGKTMVVQRFDTAGAARPHALEIVPLEKGEARQFPVVGDRPQWSPSGEVIAYHAPDGLRTISPNGGDSRLLVSNATDSAEAFYAAWSPDGSTLYYVSKGVRGSSIRAAPAKGGASRVVVRFDDPTRQHTRYGFTTDGRTFYFTMGSHESDIWVVELGKR